MLSTKAIGKEAVILKAAEKDKCVADDFYSTTNYTTMVFHENKWLTVQNQRMDAMIVINDEGASCKKLREIKKGDMVVCTEQGVKVLCDSEAQEDGDFGFMSNCVSSERRNELLIRNIANDLYYNGKKLTLVAGPVIVHTGGDTYLCELIRRGYVDSVLTGNAVAVHDIEKSLYGTSLGVCAKSGRATANGYRNHMRAINHVMKYGSIKEAVEHNGIQSGIMYQCVKNNVPYVLAGSLRDDGPLPDTVTDMIQAQDAYNKHLKNADVVLILGSMLHGIATGNMLSAKIDMICVDINPAVVTKLSDRGSGQAAGIVTDVGLFLNLLVKEIEVMDIREKAACCR